MEERVFDNSIELKGNAMLNHKPELFNEWDFEKNNELGLDIYKVTYGSGKEVFWLCEKNHTWKASISNRAKENGTGCPICSNKQVLIGFNDMWTTNPELASQLLNPDDGYKYTQMSNQCVDWRCRGCKRVIKDRVISSICIGGLACGICSDGKSVPEKTFASLLSHIGTKFEWDCPFNWSDGKRYDFYLPDHNWIVEIHGEQHYDNSFISAQGRTLEEEQENDKLKERLAKENGIDKYVVIDARKSDFHYIKNSILNSDIGLIFNEFSINWDTVHKTSLKSLVLEACRMWNEGFGTPTDIGKEIRIERNTVASYLSTGASLGICTYTPEKSKQLSDAKSKKAIVQLTLEGELVRHWDSVADYCEETGVTQARSISLCCNGNRNKAYGFVWTYKDKYEEFLRGELGIEDIVRVDKKERKVVQLSIEGELIKEWNRISDGAKATNSFVSNIGRVCKDKKGTVGGFKWMYKEDYDMEVEGN